MTIKNRILYHNAKAMANAALYASDLIGNVLGQPYIDESDRPELLRAWKRLQKQLLILVRAGVWE